MCHKLNTEIWKEWERSTGERREGGKGMMMGWTNERNMGEKREGVEDIKWTRGRKKEGE
jgi:hypothetical protein